MAVGRTRTWLLRIFSCASVPSEPAEPEPVPAEPPGEPEADPVELVEAVEPVEPGEALEEVEAQAEPVEAVQPVQPVEVERRSLPRGRSREDPTEWRREGKGKGGKGDKGRQKGKDKGEAKGKGKDRRDGEASTRAASADHVRKGKGKSRDDWIQGRSRAVSLGPRRGLCWAGYECTRANCWFEHPEGRRMDQTWASERVVSMDLSEEHLQQLKDGMFYHLNVFLRRQGLQGRLCGRQLRLVGEVDIQDVQLELVRLSSLRVELTERVPLPGELLPRVIGSEGLNLRLLSRDLGAEIRLGDGTAVITGPPQVVEDARSMLENHLISFSGTLHPFADLEQAIARERAETVHIFVDNSNICIGCQLMPTGFRDFKQRIYIKGFTEVIKGVRSLERCVVVGSRPPSNHRLWAAWRRSGYEVHTAMRNPETGREEFVDGRLVGEALMHVLQPQAQPQNVLVLATGDGNLDGQAPNTVGANFHNLVQTVARMPHWSVEVWCWRTSCHSVYKRMASKREIRLCFLDGLRKEVTMRSGTEASARPTSEEETCVQCLVAEPTHAFLPCNHRALCRDCAKETLPHKGTQPLGLCFLCRCPWQDIRHSNGSWT